MKTDPQVLTLTEAQVDRHEPVCGCNLFALVVPGACRDRFYDSEAWAALAPCLPEGVVVFVGPGRRIDVTVGRLRWATLEVAGDLRGQYMRLKPDQGLWKADHTVEAVPGRVFVDVTADGQLLGVEVLL